MTAQLPSKQRLETLIRAIECESYDEEEIVSWVNSDEILSMARALLATYEQEPAAVIDKEGSPMTRDECNDDRIFAICCKVGTPLYYNPAPVPAVPECFERLLAHAQGMAMGVDWNNGTAATHHRDKLCQAIKDCAAMLNGGKS